MLLNKHFIILTHRTIRRKSLSKNKIVHKDAFGVLINSLKSESFGFHPSSSSGTIINSLRSLNPSDFIIHPSTHRQAQGSPAQEPLLIPFGH